MQRGCDGGFVRSESIGCDLEQFRVKWHADAVHKGVRSSLIALAKSDLENQLRVTFNRTTCRRRQGSDRPWAAHAFASCRRKPKVRLTPTSRTSTLRIFLGHDAFALLASQN
jgi:hypothetical protein